MINFGIYLAYALIGISVLIILYFAVTKILQEPGGARSALIGIVGLIVVLLLSYLLSTGGDALTNPLYAKLEVSEGTSHQVGTGLVTLYIVMGLTVLSILYAEITRLLK